MVSLPLPGSRIFITGGTGFFGKSLLRLIANLNEYHGSDYHVTVLSRAPEVFANDNPWYARQDWLRFQCGDVSCDNIGPSDYTHFIHAAADSSSRLDSEPVQRIDNIIDGVRGTLEYAMSCGAKRYLFVSSGAVYGEQPVNVARLREDYSGAPDCERVDSAYGQAKRIAEQYCVSYLHQYGIEVTIARCFAFVGEYLPFNWHYAIGNFIYDALHSQRILVRGDGTALRSYMYQQDLAEWLMSILEGGQPGRSYNVGSDQPITMLELATLVCKLISPGKDISVMGAGGAAKGRNIYIPDISRAKNELGLSVKVNLENAILLSAKNASRSIGS